MRITKHFGLIENGSFRYLCNQRSTIITTKKSTTVPKEISCFNCKKILNSLDNADEIAEKRRKYLKNWNNENRIQQNKNVREWNKKNPEKRLATIQRDREKNKNKYKARSRAHKMKLRKDCCQTCAITENLHFHHTNYDKNEGFTVCARCHKAIHMAGELKS